MYNEWGPYLEPRKTNILPYLPWQLIRLGPNLYLMLIGEYIKASLRWALQLVISLSKVWGHEYRRVLNTEVTEPTKRLLAVVSKNVELSLLSVASNRALPWLRHFGNFTVYFMPVQQSRFNCSKINYAWIYQITPCCGQCLKRGSYIISRLCFLGEVHYLLSLTNCSDNARWHALISNIVSRPLQIFECIQQWASGFEWRWNSGSYGLLLHCDCTGIRNSLSRF